MAQHATYKRTTEGKHLTLVRKMERENKYGVSLHGTKVRNIKSQTDVLGILRSSRLALAVA